MKKFKPFIFFITILLAGFIITANVTHLDFDLWARLIAGMGFIEGGHVLKTDFLSYTPTHTWWDHEYGSGIIFYLFLKYFGGYSLIILQTVIIFSLFFVIYQITKLRGVKKPYNLLFYIFPLTALASNFGLPIRCHLFSFLFFTIFLYILEIAKTGKYKLLYILPVLTIIWNNLHGGVVSGLGIIFIYAFTQMLDKKPFKHYLFSVAISFAVLVVNPWGWEYLKFLFMANTMYRAHVIEWWGLFSKYHLFNQIPFKVFMLLIIILEIFKIKTEWIEKFDKTKYCILIVTLILAILHIKLLPFFVITACAFCYEDFEKLVGEKLPKQTENITGILFLAICLLVCTIKKYEIPLGVSVYPHTEVEFIKLNKLSGNILINFGLGSFVSYKLYPQNLIFMDGRYEEVYYDGMVSLLAKFYTLQPGWDEVLKKYPPDIMIIEKYYPVYYLLKTLKEWTKVYESKTFALFVKTRDVKHFYLQPTNDAKYYKDTLFDTSVKF